MIDFLNNIFYGENWYFFWAPIIIILLIGFSLKLPELIKSIKLYKSNHKK